jgi:nucleotide-binding universal stress UspA family protein
MKTLLISTDFSKTATHAVEYGYNLATQIKADVILCNAVIVPAEIPQAGMAVWPTEEYNVLMEDSDNELKSLKTRLESKNSSLGINPAVKIINETGILTDIVNEIVRDHKADMVVMGTHATSGAAHFLFGDHSRKMIDQTSKPLLLVPPQAQIAPIKKIAFATDFKQPEKDLEAIYKLVPFARLLNVDILITHVNNEKYQLVDFRNWLNQFLSELSNKADYPHIYYRIVKDSNTETGLDWLCGHGQIDMLVMIHRKHGFFDSIWNGSHTKKMADHLIIPLLVLPEKSINN